MEDKSVEIILFEQIQLALASLLNAKTIRTVEIWNSQIDNEENESPRKYPYVAVEINTDWQGEEAYNSVPNISQNTQNGSCEITIHYIYESLRTETQAWLNNRAIAHQIHRALNGLSYDQFFTPLTRTATPHEESHDRVSDIQIGYLSQIKECAITDDDLIELPVGDWSFESQNSLVVENEIIRTGKLDSSPSEVLIGDILFTQTSPDGLEQLQQDITSGVNTIDNPFLERIPQIIVFANSDGKQIIGISPTVDQTTGNITFNSAIAYNNAIITIIGWVV